MSDLFHARCVQFSSCEAGSTSGHCKSLVDGVFTAIIPRWVRASTGERTDPVRRFPPTSFSRSAWRWRFLRFLCWNFQPRIGTVRLGSNWMRRALRVCASVSVQVYDVTGMNLPRILCSVCVCVFVLACASGISLLESIPLARLLLSHGERCDFSRCGKQRHVSAILSRVEMAFAFQTRRTRSSCGLTCSR